MQNYSKASLAKNLIFDAKSQLIKSEYMDKRYQTALALLAHDFSKDRLPDKIIIYGAGQLGRALYKKIHPFTNVRCFVDRNEYGMEFQGIPICALNDIRIDEGESIIVTPTYDFESIRENIQKRYREAAVVSLDQLI